MGTHSQTMIMHLKSLTRVAIILSCINDCLTIKMVAEDIGNTKLRDCLVDIVNNMEEPVRKVSFVTLTDDSTLLEDIAKRIWVPLVVNAVEKTKDSGIDLRIPNDVVIVHGGVNARAVLSTVLWNENTRFLVVNETNAKMGQNFREYWDERVIRVFGLTEEEEGVSLYSFIPYKERDCHNAKPIRLDTWKDGSFSGDGFAIVNDEIRIKSGYGCPMNASTAIAEPAVLVPEGKKCLRGTEIEGLEARFVVELAARLNFTLTVCTPSDNHSWGEIHPAKGVLGDIHLRRSDFGCGGFIQIPERYGKVDFSYPYSGKDCLTFTVPSGAGRDRLYWLLIIFGNLRAIHWILIIASFIVSSTFFCLRSSVTPMESFMYFLNSFLGRSVLIPRFKSLKILVFSWIIFSTLISNVYQASMGREMTIPLESSEIETFKQLTDSDLVLLGHGNTFKVMNMEDPYQRAIANRLVAGEYDVNEEIGKMVKQRHSALLRPIRLILYKLLLNPRFRGEVGILKECITNYYPTIVLQKNSPFSKRFYYLVIHISESGIVNYWMSIFLPEISKVQNSFKPVTIMRSLGIFAILMTGLAISVIAFIGELVFNLMKKFIYCKSFTN